MSLSVRAILPFQFGLNGSLKFCHHRPKLVQLLLGQLLEVPFKILGTLDATSFESCKQRITLLAPQGLKTRFDDSRGRSISGCLQCGLGLANVETAKAAFNESTAAVIISSCRRWLSPPSTTIRPWAMTTGWLSAESSTTHAETRDRRLVCVPSDQISARSKRRHICTRRH